MTIILQDSYVRDGRRSYIEDAEYRSFTVSFRGANMRRSLIDTIKAVYFLFAKSVKAEEHVVQRVENARMSQTRLKALKPIDPEKDYKVHVDEPIDPRDPATISKRITTLASMSHYRLEAYVATLPLEKSEIDDDDDSFEDLVVAASVSIPRLSPSTPAIDDDQFEVDECDFGLVGPLPAY